MIIVIIAAILLVAGVSGLIVNERLRSDNHDKILVASLIAAAIGLAILFAFFICSVSDDDTNYAEYVELATYHPVVSATDNEYVRFDYYQKVKDWNSRYIDWCENRENPWISWFIYDDYKDCGTISFTLDYGECEPTMSPPTGTCPTN